MTDNKYVTVKRVTQIQIGMIVLYTAGAIGHFVGLGYLLIQRAAKWADYLYRCVNVIEMD